MRPSAAGTAPGSAASWRRGPRPLAFYLAMAAADPARAEAFLAGVRAYRAHPYRRDVEEPQPAWACGATRLSRHAGAEGGLPLLLVPSLINRAYILDLDRHRSLVRFLGAAGFDPWLIDWGVPGAAETDATLDACVAGRLLPMLAQVRRVTGRRAVLVGYCMGGLLALAAAVLRKDDVAGFVALATPWDFHAGDAAGKPGAVAGATQLSLAVAASGAAPEAVLQAAFAAVDPAGVIGKYCRFGCLDQASEAADGFVAIEDWLQDGVAMPAAVAQACIWTWLVANAPARGHWRIAGTRIDAAALAVPSLVVAPRHDRVVPLAGAEPLARAIPGADLLVPASGHVSMVAGGQARSKLWEPLAAWLGRMAGDAS